MSAQSKAGDSCDLALWSTISTVDSPCHVEPRDRRCLRLSPDINGFLPGSGSRGFSRSCVSDLRPARLSQGPYGSTCLLLCWL